MLFYAGALLLLGPSAALARPSYREDAVRSRNMIRAEYPAHARAIKSEEDRAAAVVEAFNHAWDGYYRYAFPNDELLPVTNTFGNSRNGWGASAVDALSTAIIMQQSSIVDIILNHVTKIDYSSTNSGVSLFETTIRYMGGMLAGYDLLTGPFAHLTNNTDAVNALLAQSKKLGDVLKFAFNTPSGLPVNGLNIGSQTSSDTTNDLATIGTLVLEWTRLSDLTGDPEYATLSQKGESYLLDPKPAWAEPFPGLVGSNVNVTDGMFIDATGGWQGGDDSFYEYLLKIYVYDASRFQHYKDRWALAADSSIRYLASHPAPSANSGGFSDLTFLAGFRNQTIVLNSQHLACFDGGNYLLGGAVLQNQTLIDFGLALVDGCHQTYNSTATGIGPESFAWDNSGVPANEIDFFNQHGFYITDASYDLRPEVVESYYYAYRLTGDSKYQDWAWDAFVALNATTRTESGFSNVDNVNASGGGNKRNLQESFLFAEVMKYSYIIHAPDAAWQVQKGQKQNFVYNTEAHPFKVVKSPGSY